MYKVLLPLSHSSGEKVWLGVEVVNGMTPFLFSKRAFKQLGGILDTTKDRCTLTRLQKTMHLSTNATGLYLIDMAEFCQPPNHKDSKDNVSREVFIGSACHVGVNTFFTREPMFSKTAVQTVQKRPFPMQKLHAKPSHFSILPASCVTTDSRVDQHVVEPRSCHQHPQGDGQHHHGHLDVGSASFDEHDRNQRQSSPRRRRADATTDKSAPVHVPGDDAPTCPSATIGGEPEPCGKPGDHDPSSDIKSAFGTTVNAGQQPWRPIADANTDNLERRGGDRRRLFHGVLGQANGNSQEFEEPRKEAAFSSQPCDNPTASARECANDLSMCRGTNATHSGGMGPKEDHLGQEAPGAHLLSGAERGHGLLRVEPVPISFSSSSSTRFCGLLQSPAGERCSTRSCHAPECAPACLSLDANLADMIESCRIECSRFAPQNIAKKYQQSIEKSIEQAQNVIDEIFVSAPSSSIPRKRLVVLEVYAGETSPITESLRALGAAAYRFTKRDGDLSTPAGRQALWSLIDQIEPDHIFVAPECGPWSGWNRFNASRSVRLWDHVHAQQDAERVHIRLCAQLCDYQTKRHKHFHLEQPVGSSMISTDEFKPIEQQTNRVCFDMCAFGLKLPKTSKFIRKRSQIWTTSDVMLRKLAHHDCPGNHDHTQIAGSMHHDGKTIPVSSFCATYCHGFADTCAKLLCEEHSNVCQNSFVHEDEPPMKRPRADPERFKKRRVNSSAPAVSTVDQPSGPVEGTVVSGDSLWHEACRMANRLAPRVGNHKYEADSDLGELVQHLVKDDFKVSCVFICRGIDRFQVPISAPPSHESPWCQTLCIHRADGTLHDLGIRNWHMLTRAQRVAKTIPSRLTLTIFGNLKGDANPDEPVPPHVENSMIPSDINSRVPAVDSFAKVPDPKTVCEGWAPPPTPLHGPCFRALTSDEKQQLVKLHKNLGHPDPMVLSAHLRAQGAAEHIIRATQDFVCDACVETQKPHHQRPAKLHPPREFNDVLGIDGFFWKGKGNFQCYVLHVYDEASGFHLAKRLDGRNLDHAIPAFQNLWLTWAGTPQHLYLDPAGEFRADRWLDYLQTLNTSVFVSADAWQRGRIERHGSILKDMLHRLDTDQRIESIGQFDEILSLCCQAKNALSKNHGYSPEQFVLGKATSLPGSLTSDESTVAHSLALGSDLESERFRALLERRTKARQAFILSDNAEAIRRATLRQSRPIRGPFQPGQLVLYWTKRSIPNRSDVGRWHGPARVIVQEGNSIVWLSHADRLIRRPPENIRPASLREWNTWSDHVPEVRDLPQNMPIPQPVPNESQENDVLDDEYSPSLAPEIPPPHQADDQPEGEASHPPTVGSGETTPTAVTDTEETSPGENAPEESFLLQATNLIEQNNPLDPDQDGLMMFDTFYSSDCPNEAVSLAEDGMPFIDDPIDCNTEECFILEIPLKSEDLTAWSLESNPSDMACVAAAGQRARSEVQVKYLSDSDRKLFDIAKNNELSCWITTNALRPILRKSLNPEQILKSRWVLTWKNVEADLDKPAHKKAKARLVVLGYQDPQLTSVARDSPTLTKEGRNSILQLIATQQWELTSFDIKTAFLRGKADEKNPLAMEPPVELRQKLRMSPDQVCALVGNAYGRVDAPLLFYKELTRQLKALNFRVHPLEPCVFLLESGSGSQRKLHGAIGVHVDDGVGGGDQYFQQQLVALSKVLPFGSHKHRKFTFTGIELEQLPDFSIRASQADYIHRIMAIDIPKIRREQPTSPTTDSEKSKLRGLVGSLQYAVTHTRPDLASKLGEVQTDMASPTVQTLLLCNKVLREAQEHSDVQIYFRNIPVDQLTHVSFGDASFASPKQLSSFQGSLICATTSKLQENVDAPISPLSWSSKKISRVVRSTLSAEAYSMSRSVDRLGWLRLLWGVMVIPQFPWQEPSKAYAHLPMGIITTDCRSLYDLVSRTAMPQCEEYRTTLEVLLIREQCQDNCVFRWIPTTIMLADALTKPMDPSLLRLVLQTGIFCLYDESSILRQNANRRLAVSWLSDKSQSNNSFRGAMQ